MSLKQLISFEIDGLLFGLDILLVKEINNKLELTPVYNVPEYIVGTSNLRGQVITIIDLGCRFGMPTRVISKGSRIIVIKTEDELLVHLKSGKLTDHTSSDKVGIPVDTIGDVIEIDDRHIQPAPANFSQIESHFIEGVYQLDDKLLIVLKLEMSLAMENTVATLNR